MTKDEGEETTWPWWMPKPKSEEQKKEEKTRKDIARAIKITGPKGG